MDKKTFFYAFRTSLPVMAGYAVLGMGFGVLLHSSGLAWYWAPVMCVLMYSGSLQYVGVDLIAGGAGLLHIALMSLIINGRHLFYGLTMLTKYQKIPRGRAYAIFAMTDETFSLVCSADPPPDVDINKFYVYLSLFNQCYWIAGGLAGALLGTAVAFNSAGIEFSMTALFTVALVENWEKRKQSDQPRQTATVTGLAASAVCLLLFGADKFLIPTMLAITALLLLERRLEKGADSHV